MPQITVDESANLESTGEPKRAEGVAPVCAEVRDLEASYRRR
ncbi:MULTISPECIES: hypothetical protein [unclassified Streptomyces]|nr:hypothetical protein [Streptomyces sp. NBC_01750]WSB03172.1 hypothetical protein OIE54_30245 [Streptomyces sp. NBC_01794]WSD32560.1 hypothetical protein OG966_11900 [Streptomyces sp. NBC_01750]